MSNEPELSARLRRLGVVKGARTLKPAPPPDPALQQPISPSPPDADTTPLTTLLPGSRLETTAVGQCLLLDHVYPLSHQHGRYPLQDLLQFSAADAAPICDDARFHQLDLQDFLFLDTETTGLAGAGTIAFMVGVAYFEKEALVVRQYFVPDLGDEAAMLSLLESLLTDKAGLITFNGRTFDIPLLDNRYLMNRMPADLRQIPHLDLLLPARRLWRTRLGSVALGALEAPVLGVQRTEEDVPGWLIPSLYHQYIRSGDGRELVRVFYHNQIDLLSMVTLAAQILRLFQQPRADDHPADLYSLGKWQARLGQVTEAERCFQWAATAETPLQLFHQTLQEWGALLKRHGRRDEAVPLWQQMAATSFEDVGAHVELAKYFEWHETDLPQAIYWTEQALTLVQSWPGQTEANLVQADLEHRLARLQRKQL